MKKKKQGLWERERTTAERKEKVRFDKRYKCRSFGDKAGDAVVDASRQCRMELMLDISLVLK